MSDDDIDNSNLEQPEESEAAHFVWQYFAVANNTDARKVGAKNAVCMFSSVNAVCSSTYLRKSCLGPRKAGICPCIAIYKKDDDRRSALRTAQKTIPQNNQLNLL